ncbi:hypothetical protein DFR24_1131 [Panacagrimonas perspica]|uniref:Uncharacterized protein n=1 Tax=Panacagrimonas perspica TaxID=381431 RepID=A0A4S3K4N7_9GAMM|nr:hypothetical protein [Panacagrimonas perspica]TDU31750.1 hypothetical protein DFR24_1131 [Panacagrimonas perspica]THD03039.1 hypothetical protein B1810_10595 [Panacagrimonas perspica]
MNNSLKRMIEGMAATLRNEVIPHIGTEFARGQAFGVIYMLNSIGLRAAWSPAFVGEQIAAQIALRDALAPLLAGIDAPALPREGSPGLDVQALESLRDDNEGRICALVEWHGSANLDAQRAAAIELQFRTYMDRQLKHELQTSAKPMFAEMSSGSE